MRIVWTPQMKKICTVHNRASRGAIHIHILLLHFFNYHLWWCFSPLLAFFDFPHQDLPIRYQETLQAWNLVTRKNEDLIRLESGNMHLKNLISHLFQPWMKWIMTSISNSAKHSWMAVASCGMKNYSKWSYDLINPMDSNVYLACTHFDTFQPDSSCCARGYSSNSWEIPHQPYTNPLDQKSHTCANTVFLD